MRMITKEQLEALRSRYPAGTRVELLQMDDVQAPPIGTKGTVTGVDDTGSLMVCLLYTSPSPRDGATSRMPSSA